MNSEYKKRSTFFLWSTSTCKTETQLFALCKSKSLKPENVLTLTKLGLMIFSCLVTLHGTSKWYKDSDWRRKKCYWGDMWEIVCWMPCYKSGCVGRRQPRSPAFLFVVPRIEVEPYACSANTPPVSCIPGPILPHIPDQNIFSSKASWMVLARHAYIELFGN